ncbi:coat protein [Beet yellow stunt virus]|uniref:Coat protein n=1 Tax=Beet yellow stunt virus TaxID=35290 RepID=Q65858_9CLOS|nr:coat protein [Beet yellow stunt virus]AAC55665.1 coat protein [Beet yellow stunt virus]
MAGGNDEGSDDSSASQTMTAKDMIFAPFENFARASATCLNGENKKKLFEEFSVRVKTQDVTESGIPTTLGMTLYALATLSTSSKIDIEDKTPLVSAKIDAVNVTITYEDIKNFVNSLTLLKNYKNKLRVFARTFEEEYLRFVRQYKHILPNIARANKHGIPADYSYLAADFVQTSNLLKEHEQAVLLEGRNAATASSGTTRESAVNLKYLGGSSK